MVELSDIVQAQSQLVGIIRPTKLIYSEFFSEFFSKEIYFKPENLQIVGSFKVRGAYLKLLNLSRGQNNRKVVCASAGNHAQGVAWAGKKLDFKVKVVMPKLSPVIKIAAVRKFGAVVVLFGDNFEEAYEKAQEIAQEEKYILIHPYDDETIIAGQGTIGLEILQELPDVGSVIIPIGGGGLAAGVSLAVKGMAKHVHVVGVRSKSRIAEGIFVKNIGKMSGGLIKRHADEIVWVGEEEISTAILMLMEKSKLIVEGAGAAGLAALLAGKVSDLPQPIVVVLSGGNIDISLIGKIIEKGLHNLERMISVVIELDDKPGALNELSGLIAEGGANIFQVYHERAVPNLSLTKSRVKFILETHDALHAVEIIKKLKSAGYKVKRAV